MKYSIVKLNEDQTEENEVVFPINSLDRFIKTNKNLVLVNKRDEQSLITIDQLVTRGEECYNDKEDIFYKFKFVENGCPLDDIDLRWITRLHFSWYNRIGDYLRSDEFLENLSIINGSREEVDVYPSKEDVFKAYQSPFNKIRVVIVGQDPYPDPKSMATGLKQN